MFIAKYSSVPARVIASLLSGLAEELGLLDANQAGFCSSRSTADVVQMMARVKEVVEDCVREVNEVI